MPDHELVEKTGSLNGKPLWAPSDSLALHGEDLVASSIVRIPVAALERLDLWIEAEGFKGWDPHDGLNSPCLHWARRWRLPGIAILQLLRRSPVNLRPLLGIRKGYNPKAMGLFLATYAQKYEVTRLQKHLELTRFFFNWLVQNAAQGYAGPCWGYNFDWPNRAFLAPAGTPTIVNTRIHNGWSSCRSKEGPVGPIKVVTPARTSVTLSCILDKPVEEKPRQFKVFLQSCHFVFLSVGSQEQAHSFRVIPLSNAQQWPEVYRTSA